MKYLELISRDEKEVEKSNLSTKASLAKNSAERILIELEGEIKEAELRLEEAKANIPFSLRDVIERTHEVEILERELETAEDVYDELFTHRDTSEYTNYDDVDDDLPF